MSRDNSGSPAALAFADLSGWRQFRDLNELARRGHMVQVRVRNNRTIGASDPLYRCTRERCTCVRRAIGGNSVVRTLHSSAACPYARYRFEDEVLPEVMGKLGAYMDQAFMVTITSGRYAIPWHKLGSYDPSNLLRAGKERLKLLAATRSPGVIAIGAVEVDIEETVDKTFVARPHLHIIVGNAAKEDLGRTMPLRRSPDDPYRPVDVRRVINLGGPRYALKCRLRGPRNKNGDEHDKRRGSPSSDHDADFSAWANGFTINELILKYNWRFEGAKVVTGL